jgi:PAS domain S-box-containing protein
MKTTRERIAWRLAGALTAGRPLAIGRRLLAGFCLGVVVFVVSNFVSYKSARQFAGTLDWVRHTHEVLAKLQKVDSDLLGAQTAVRGFVITGREDFLTPYPDALRDLQDDELALRWPTADNPRQQRRLTELEALSHQLLAFYEETLSINRVRGVSASAALISTGRGQEITKQIWLVIGALEREERDLLTQREAHARAQTARTFFILPIVSFIGLGLLLAVLFFLNAEAIERRGAEASSRLAAEIVKSTGDAVITKTLDGLITSWNPAAERIFGYTAQEAVGRPVLMFIPRERADEEKEILTKIKRGERVKHFETVRLRKDGRRANVSVTISPFRDNMGKIVGASKILRDITEQKEAEEALRGSEERFRTMANSITQLVWIARADGFIYWYNERWYEYTGTTHEQAEGWGWQIVHDPAALPKVVENWTRAIGCGQPFEMEFPLRGADGTFRTFLTRVRPLKDPDGRVVQWFGTNTDVDDLKRVEESLRASQARLSSTLAAGSIGTWTWDIVNDRLSADEFTARIFSIEPAAAAKGLPSEVYLRAVMEEDQPGVAQGLTRAIESCGPYDIEYRVRQKDGGLRWLQAKGRVEGDAAGKAVNFHGAVMDITERKRTEGRFRRLVDSNAQGVMFWNTKGEITRANDAFLSIVGYTREDQEAGRIGWAAMTPPEYTHLDHHSLEELAAKGICTPFEKEYIRKDGSRVPVLLGAAIFEDNPDEGVCFLLDITERRRTDQALRESEEHFRFLNDLSEATRVLADGEQIMAVTARMLGKHLRVSRCAYADVKQGGEQFTILHDYTDGCASTVGHYQLSLFGEHAAATLLSAQTLIIRDVDSELLLGDGLAMFNEIGIKAIITCPLLKDGGLRAMMAVHQTTARDWTSAEIAIVKDVVERCWSTIQRRAAEEDVHKLNSELEQRVVERTAQLEAANRAKSMFLSTMSHEIRTPMNAILGYSQLMLRDTALGTDAKANLRIINRSGEHLLTLINDVLDMAKIEAGRTELNPTTFRLAGLVDDVAGMSHLWAKAKELLFQVFFDRESEPYVVADEGKIRQVLINLLANAIKFTQLGEIKLRIALEQRGDKRSWLSACVEDTGSGISEQDQKKLFEPFSRAELGINGQEGTGLGLAIARKHARLMGGDVTVSSSPGIGSIFRFGIPVGHGVTGLALRRAASRRVVGIHAGGKNPGILIVDDQIENREWLMKLLAAVGFSVKAADNGEAAIRTWEEWKPQMILMDVHMPVMDGLEATRRIKADHRGSETAIVVLSASAMDEERRMVFESGADGFLAKPCREDDLLETVRGFLKIVYDYDETDATEEEFVAGLPVLNAERLGKLPRELIEKLRDATLSGNKKLLNDLIRKLRESDAIGCADGIQRLADKYQYQTLSHLLEEACSL